MKDKDLLELLGLTDRTIELELTKDINNVIENGIEKYLEEQRKKEEEKQKFIRLFKECYDELCLFMEKDPEHKVAISCYTCLKGMDLSKQYGKPKRK